MRKLAVSAILIIFLTVFLLDMLPAPTAQAAPGNLKVWVVSDGDKILRDAAPRAASAVWSEAGGRIGLRAARNEYVAFQVMVTAAGGALSGVNVAVPALTRDGGGAGIAAENVELFREWYLDITEPSSSMYGEGSTTGTGWYPDALVPFDAPDGGAPFGVAAGQNQGVWVDVYVPGSAAPGTYRSSAVVSAAGETAVTIPIDLVVWDFTLPQESHLDSWFMYQPDELADAHGVYKYDENYQAIEQQYAVMARQHRMNWFTSIYPEYTGTGATVTINWDSWHDELASRFLDGTIFGDGIGLSRYCIPISYFEPDPDSHGGRGSPEYEATVISLLQQYKEHFVAKGWFDRTFIWPLDEPNTPEAYDLVRYYGELIDRSGTGFPMMETEGPTPQDPAWGTLVGYVDIWCCGGVAWPGPMHERQAAGEEAWTYNGGEPYAGSQIIDTGGLAMRTWPWAARRYGVQGWLLWETCYFQDIYNGGTGNDVWTDPLTFDSRHRAEAWPDWGNGDGTLFYPGTARGIAGPVSSVRMKEWRRGAQDYEYMWLLDRQGRSAFADAQAAAMVPYAFGDAEGLTSSRSEDPAVWESARAAMGAELNGLDVYTNKLYFAEGFTGSGFQEYLTLGNPGAGTAHVRITYNFTGGGYDDQYLDLPGNARATVDVNARVGAGREVSAEVASDLPVVAERPMYFSYGGAGPGAARDGGHDVAGVATPATAWYFAEGYTGPGFDEYVCLLNPGDTAATVTFRFQTESAGEVVRTGYAVPAQARATFKANDLLSPYAGATSLAVESTHPVVAERPMYFDYGGWTGGSCTSGVASLGTAYSFAEGTTRPGFAEYLTLQNPGGAAIDVQATYQFGDGQPPMVKAYTVGAKSRATVFVPSEVGAGRDVSVSLTSAAPFLAERPMYFDYSGWTGGSCVAGAGAAGRDCFFAEGYTGPGFHEYLCLQNPGSTAATVRVDYYTQEVGALAARTVEVPAASRVTLWVNVHAGEGYQLSSRVRVLAGPAIVAERPMYFDYSGWDGGHDVLGVPL